MHIKKKTILRLSQNVDKLLKILKIEEVCERQQVIKLLETLIFRRF